MTSAIIRLAAASVWMRVISSPVGARTISIWMPEARRKALDTACSVSKKLAV